jgi:hypothetical protein
MKLVMRLGSKLLVAVSLAIPGTAAANVILFDFNSLGAGLNSSDNGTDPIETYMEGIYGSDITVRNGAQTRKDRVEGRPNGNIDMFLGNSDGATARGDCSSPGANAACHPNPKDTFLINRWDASTSQVPANLADRIIITFVTAPIVGLEVDWEIFPVTQDGANADITIKADGVQIFFSQLTGSDKELGDLGHFSYTFTSPVNTLEFIDWRDAPIGIDNLRVTRRRVPLPGTLALLGAGFLALGFGRTVGSRARKQETPPTSS